MLAAVALSFAVPAWMSMHTGDDLGYMFADTTHHGGDGQRVHTLWQCLQTQWQHYHTTNGRAVVHTAVMILLNLVPLWLYRLLNVAVFGLTWLGTLQLCRTAGRRPTLATAAAAWAAMYIMLPQPGLVMMTLVAYAVNYLWVLCAAVWWLVCLQRCGNRRPWWLYVLTAAVGMLHEGCGLPLCAALSLLCLIHRGKGWGIALAMIAGTAVCAFAPGNAAHAAQGGGLAWDALAHKTGALGFDLLISPAAWALAVTVAVIAVKARYAGKSVRRALVPRDMDILLITAAVTGLLIATLTFTTPRQLSFPFWCAATYVLRRAAPFLSGKSGKYLSAAFIALTVAVIAFITVLKIPVYQRYQSFMHNARTQTVIYPADSLPPQPLPLPAPLCRALAPDPLANTGLVAIGDRYTRQGLQRLYGHPVTALLPASPQWLIRSAQNADANRGLSRCRVSTTRPPRGIAYEQFAGADSCVWYVSY